MVAMGTKKTKKVEQATRSGEPLNVWIDEDLARSLVAYLNAQRARPTKTAVVELAMREFLEREGHWPPKNS